MNLLILSCGTRDNVVQYFKAAFAGKGRVVCTDCSPYAPALYEADAHYIVPRITAPEYLIAANEAKFRALGVQIIGSDYALCERTLDKWALFVWMEEHGYPCARTYRTMESFGAALERGEVQFPVFVKPMKGSASIQIARADDMETAAFLFAHGDEMIIQEYMTGQEIGADVYIDLVSKKVVSIFTKKKLVMRAGETDKAVSFIDEKLFIFLTKFVEESGFAGQIDIDLFEKDGIYLISEVNPRFGGGYPHAYACGADHMTLIRNNLMGMENPVQIGGYAAGKVMMKYNEIMLTDVKDK